MNNVPVTKIEQSHGSCPFLQETMDLLDKVRVRALDLFEKRGGSHGGDLGDWLQAEREVFHVPGAELAERDGEFVLQLAVPGFDAKDIRVVALDDAVVVEAQSAHTHRNDSGAVHFCEFGERRVFRRIPLPELVNRDTVTADLDKGILRIRAAKAAPAVESKSGTGAALALSAHQEKEKRSKAAA